MNKRYYEHTLPIIRGSLSNTYNGFGIALYVLEMFFIQDFHNFGVLSVKQ